MDMQYDAENINTALAYVLSITKKTCTDPRCEQTRHVIELTTELMDVRYDGCPKIHSARNTLLGMCEKFQTPATVTASVDSQSPAVGGDAYAGGETSEDGNATWSVSDASGVRFSDITGAHEALQTIRESLIVPVKFPSIFKQVRAKAWKAVLLYGPPGTGKSMIARATASESSANFYNACCAELTSKWVGGSEKLMKSLFAHARAHRPAIVFFDEIDSVAGMRDSQKSIADQRLTNQMLIELDACVHGGDEEPIFVMAATNLPWQIDMAVMRRFPKRIYIALPEDVARGKLFQNACIDSIIFNPVQLELVVSSTRGFSGADICNIVNDVGLEPLRLLTGATAFVVTVAADSGDVESVCAEIAAGTTSTTSIQGRVKVGEWESAMTAGECAVTANKSEVSAARVGGQDDDTNVSNHQIPPETHSYVLRNTTLELIIDKFSEHVVRVGPVTFQMVQACIQRCKASVDHANICKYEEYNQTQTISA